MTDHIHYSNLHEFVKPKNLRPVFKKINRSLDELVSVIIEPEYYHDNMVYNSMPDYLFRFSDGVWIPGEMKGSINKVNKAKNQLRQGKIYCEEMFGYSPEIGLFIVYDIGSYRSMFYEI
jgi:hypothetical protein